MLSRRSNFQKPRHGPNTMSWIWWFKGSSMGTPDSRSRFCCIDLSGYLHTVNMGIHLCIHLHIVLRECLSISSHSPPSSFHCNRNAQSDWSDDTVACTPEAALGTNDKANCVRHRKAGNLRAAEKGRIVLGTRSCVLEASEVVIIIGQMYNRCTTEQKSKVSCLLAYEMVQEIEISYNDRRQDHNQYRDETSLPPPLVTMGPVPRFYQAEDPN